MTSTPDRFGEYLLPEEHVMAVCTATLSDAAARETVSVGMTDRRLLCLGDETALTVGYDAINTIRSRRRTRVAYRGNDHRLLLGCGALVALLGFVATVALTAGALVPLVSLVALGGVAATVTLLVDGDDVDLDRVVELAERTDIDLDDADALRRLLRYVDDRAADHDILAFGSGSVAVLGFLATAAVASGLLSFVVLAGSAGVALGAYAHGHRHDYDGIEVERRRERSVSIDTADGRTVRLSSDPSVAIDRELSKLAFAEETDPVQVASHRS